MRSSAIFRLGRPGRLGGALLALAAVLAVSGAALAAAPSPRITVLYDAFGDDAALEKDWGFAALIEIDGRRILFDTGNDAEVFARNVAAKGVDLGDLDFVVLSHRHVDHVAGLDRVLAANPGVRIYTPQENFGNFGSAVPAAGFYRREPSLPAHMQYFDGEPPDTLQFGSLWPDADFQPLAETTQIAPDVWIIAQVSEAPGTRELRELSLAIRTEHGIVLVVGCSHPGIGAIVAEARTIDPDIHLVVGGFHFVAADDATVAAMVEDLLEQEVDLVAPGHCTGEATFAALQRAFGERYLYAGVGAVLDFGDPAGPRRPRGVAAALSGGELAAYRLLALSGHEGHAHAGTLAHGRAEATVPPR